ncbi:MAG: VCBS repeat-containing protein [Anaerolineales bacterium]|nr:VCBS repeat-containing protein [Anaerolineales bacterium]MCB8991743.1 VCBS repeat-containing protein [Ardenticatenaceae bacterium]
MNSHTSAHKKHSILLTNLFILLMLVFFTSSLPFLYAADAQEPYILLPNEPATTNTIPVKWTFDLPAKACAPGSTATNCHFAAPALADINEDGLLDVVAATNNGWVVVVNHNGNEIWRKDISPYMGASTNVEEIAASPAIADIDHDNHLEIVIAAGTSDSTTCEPGGVIVLSHTGSVETGWPKLTLDENGDGCRDGFFSTPALGDLDKDGDLEIVVGGFDKRVYAWHHNGQLLSGFPIDSYLADRFPTWGLEGLLADTVWSSPSLVDLTGDGYLDILIGTDEGNFDSRWGGETDWVCPYSTITPGYCGGSLYGIDRFGNILPGYPKYILEHIQSTPAVMDIDFNGTPEIFIGTGTYYYNSSPEHPTYGFRLFGLNAQGGDLPNWGGGKPTNGPMPASPAIGDIAGDSGMEIVALSMDHKLYAWHADGTIVSGFPMTPLDWQSHSYEYNVGRTPILADYDGDNKMEIFVPTAWNITVIDGDGQQLTPTSQPAEFNAGGTILNTPAIGDLNNNGRLELVVQNSKLSVWELPNSSTQADWPMFKQNPARTGVNSQPILQVFPQNLFIMRESGSNTITNITIKNGGDGSDSLNWTATPTGLTLGDSSGTLSGGESQTIEVTLPTSGLGVGTYNLGSIEVTGMVDGHHVANSPTTIQVTVYIVDTLYQSFLPGVLKN